MWEQIAPTLGYTYVNPNLPIAEYYEFFNMKTFSHGYGYLYVPIEKANLFADTQYCNNIYVI